MRADVVRKRDGPRSVECADEIARLEHGPKYGCGIGRIGAQIWNVRRHAACIGLEHFGQAHEGATTIDAGELIAGRDDRVRCVQRSRKTDQRPIHLEDYVRKIR